MHLEERSSSTECARFFCSVSFGSWKDVDKVEDIARTLADRAREEDLKRERVFVFSSLPFVRGDIENGTIQQMGAALQGPAGSGRLWSASSSGSARRMRVGCETLARFRRYGVTTIANPSLETCNVSWTYKASRRRRYLDRRMDQGDSVRAFAWGWRVCTSISLRSVEAPPS